MAKRRKIPEVNAGSMADISFLLLIFFLVATTMNVDTGIQRLLPPIPPEDQKQDDLKIKERNLMLIFVSRFDNIMAGGEGVDIRQLKEKAVRFIKNQYNEENLPESKDVEIEHLGVFPVSEGVISLQNDRGTSYEMYIKVQNELTRAFNEVRNEVSMDKFGVKFDDLDKDRRDAIQKAVPLKISEAEPRNVEGGR